MTDPSFVFDAKDQVDALLDRREPPLDWASYDPMLTEAEIAELAEAVDRYAPCQRDMDEVNYRLVEEEDATPPRPLERRVDELEVVVSGNDRTFREIITDNAELAGRIERLEETLETVVAGNDRTLKERYEVSKATHS